MTEQATVLTRGIELDLSPEQVFDNLHKVAGFFYLDSGMAEHELSRFSYLGVQPFLTLKSRGNGVDRIEGKTIEHFQGNPFDILSAHLREMRLMGGSPMVPFIGGGVGYFGYEMGRITNDLDLNSEDDLGLPEMVLSFYKTILAYEHKTKRWFGAAVDLSGGRGPTVRKRLGNDIEKLRELATKPHRGPAVVPAVVEPEDGEEGMTEAPHGETMTIDGVSVRTSLSRDAYLEGVKRIQEHIAAGDIYQANLTQRWSLPFEGDPGKLYEALRKASPAPFGVYLNAGDAVIAGSSPECFLSLEGRTVQTRPIKGTRPRGATPEEDARLGAELEASAKDKAELTMIADLERNDLGRVCASGTVRVDELHRLESFANVHHLVSVVTGDLEPGVEAGELLKATFPSGSITGAPKRRAMEILDSIEGRVRGPYTGAMGYLGFEGSLSLNVAIRTMVLSQGQCHVGVGSGIVADSNPESEYDECVAKARGMLTALRETVNTPPQEPVSS